jgi:diguanylate cyclase (GGDEF)-like protein
VTLTIDPFASYVVCGAASLAAAAMLQMVRPDEARLRQALQVATCGFGLLGLGLFQLLFTASALNLAASWLMLWSTALSGPIFALTLARLAGQPRISPQSLVAAAVVATAVTSIAALVGGLAPGIGLAVLSTLGAAMMVLACWPFIVRPRHLVERALGLLILAYFASWVLRASFTLSYAGPRLAHELYVPAALLSGYAILYAVLPIVIASLLLNTVSARLHQQLKSRASTDELTGALMRRAIRDMAPAAVARAQGAGRESALLMLDIDHFKNVNDMHGHLAGDDVLHHTAQVLQAQLRPDALLGRFGGEEFMVLVEVKNIAAARAVAERLRLALAHSPCPRRGAQPIPITISAGVALFGPGEGLDTTLMRADEALYRAKRGGRDRVEIAIAAAR